MPDLFHAMEKASDRVSIYVCCYSCDDDAARSTNLHG